MQNFIRLSKQIIALSIIIFTLHASADGDEAGIFKRWIETKNIGISSVKFEQYNELCGSCHFSYQPGLLPSVSWEKIMTDLTHHFGQSVNLTETETRTMRRYVLDNSAGHVNDEISHQILHSLKYDPIPVRITTTPFFIDKHKEESSKNIGECAHCHQDAEQGLYSKKNIHRPNQSQQPANNAEIKL